VERKKMRDVNVGDRETWNESERLREKRERERERKKGESERGTYEQNKERNVE
jgi:hypothetical protein